MQAPLSLIGVMAAIARRVIRDMIATITVATTPTMGAVVIAAAAVTAVTVRAAAMVPAAVMRAMAATAGPTIDESRLVE